VDFSIVQINFIFRQVSWLSFKAWQPLPIRIIPIVVMGQAPLYSGGTAPDLHRLPYSPRLGHLKIEYSFFVY